MNCSANAEFATMSEKEIHNMNVIEAKRNTNENKRKLYTNLETNIYNSNLSEEFRLHCLSVSVKIMDNNQLENLINNLP